MSAKAAGKVERVVTSTRQLLGRDHDRNSLVLAKQRNQLLDRPTQFSILTLDSPCHSRKTYGPIHPQLRDIHNFPLSHCTPPKTPSRHLSPTTFAMSKRNSMPNGMDKAKREPCAQFSTDWLNANTTDCREQRKTNKPDSSPLPTLDTSASYGHTISQTSSP